jgi:uncharacterized membrane protein
MFVPDYPLLDVFWTMIVFFVWVMWICVVISMLLDVSRRDDSSGWAGRGGWMILIIFLPLLGVLIYLITQGKGMRERRAADIADIADVLCFATAPLLERATSFRLGESLVTRRIASHAAFVRFGPRIGEEGGVDVPAMRARG